MLRSWHLGRVRGIDVFVHWSFLLVPLFAYSSHLDRGHAAAGVAAALSLGVFGCVLLHEFGHAFMARAFGIPTRDITLYPVGGVARLERLGDRPAHELLIALAGPAVNVAIALAIGGGLLLSGTPLRSELASVPVRFLVQLMVVNVGLVLFNMLPAFPMDGGRVLRAVLELGVGRATATAWAVRVGTVFAALFVAAGLFGGFGLGLTLIGGLVWLSGRQELAQVRAEADRRRVRPILVEPVAATGGYVYDPLLRQWVLLLPGGAGGARPTV